MIRPIRLLRAALLGTVLTSNLAFAQTGPGFGPSYQGGGATVTGTGCLTGVSIAIQKGNGSNGCTPATSGTDFAPATTGTAIELGNGSGGFSSYAGAACAGGQFASALSATGVPTCSTPAGGGNLTISPATGNVSGDCLQLSNTTTTVTDAGFGCVQPSTQLAKATSFTLTAGQFLAQDPVLATGTLTETFPATSTLNANGFQVLQNSGTSTLTIQPNAADQVCPAGAACGTAGVAYALTANYGALISTDAAGHLYVTPMPPSGSGGAGTVTTTGSPANGNLAKFSGATSVTNADLTGDVTTSGGVATTLATVNANVGTFGDATHCATVTVSGKGLVTAASQSTSCPGGSSGAVTLISTLTAANSASLAWTGLTGTNYILKCSNIVSATNSVVPYIQGGEGGTPTWKTASYLWSAHFTSTAGTGTDGGSASDSGISVSFDSSLGNAAPGVSFSAQLYNLAGTVTHMIDARGSLDTGGGGHIFGSSGGQYTGDTVAWTAVRLIMSSGNITSGSCSLYSENT